MRDCFRIVILPGLDGTGRLLTPFVQSLAHFYPVDVIRYPTGKPLTYDELLSYVRAQLPTENFVLIGESFSGPLAMRIASEGPIFLKGVVLGASFVRLDLPFKTAIIKLIDWVPVSIVPLTVLDLLLTNGRATAVQRNLLKQVLRSVSPSVLAARAREALIVDLVGAGTIVHQPILCLRAVNDRLVPSSAANLAKSLGRNIIIQNIAAPHFIFQTEPQACAEAVVDFISRLR